MKSYPYRPRADLQCETFLLGLITAWAKLGCRHSCPCLTFLESQLIHSESLCIQGSHDFG